MCYLNIQEFVNPVVLNDHIHQYHNHSFALSEVWMELMIRSMFDVSDGVVLPTSTVFSRFS